MTDTAEFPYRIAVGWVSVATLEGSSAYLLTSFPVQSDQRSALLNPWGPPDDKTTTFPAYTRYGQYATQGQWSDGPVNFKWGMSYLTEVMVSYWETLIWTADQSIQNAAVTVKTRTANTAGFSVYQCIANRPRPNQSYKRGVRGLTDYITEFVAGTLIT